MKKVYLAGHSIEFEYRQYCKDNYSDDFHLIDPIDRSLDVLEKDKWNVKEIAKGDIMISNDDINYIVEEDKKDILSSDYVLAYIRQPTFGTIMEIMFAFDNNIPVVTVNPDGNWKGDIWLRYHSIQILPSLDEGFQYINAIEDIGTFENE